MNRALTQLGLALTVSAFVMSVSESAELATKKTLSLEVTKKMVAAAEAFATSKGWNVVIAIVDEGGHLIYLQRMDGVQTGSVKVAMRKAEAAAAFKRPTKVFQDALGGGATAILGLPGGIPFDGGVPITVEGQILGAIGVSGVTGQQDGMIARAGAESLAKILAD